MNNIATVGIVVFCIAMIAIVSQWQIGSPEQRRSQDQLNAFERQARTRSSAHLRF